MTKLHKNHKADNQLLIKYKDKAFDIIRNFELSGEEFSLDDFVEAFKGTKKAVTGFMEFAQELINELTASNRLGYADAFVRTRKSVYKFCNNRKLRFKDITPRIPLQV